MMMSSRVAVTVTNNVRRILLTSYLRQSQYQFSTTCASSDDLNVKLYQYNICPFCHKVKALLDYSAHPYEVVEVNPLTKAELKFPDNNYKKVPVAIINGEQVNGSDEIIAELLDDSTFLYFLEKKWEQNAKSDDPTSRPDSVDMMTFLSFESNETTEWNDWATNELAAVLYPNLCRTLSSSYEAFKYVEGVKEFSYLEKRMIRSIGSFAMYMAASRIKSKL